MIALVERTLAGLPRQSVELFDGFESSEAWPLPCLHIAVAVASEGFED